jgi:hypothetical protein
MGNAFITNWREEQCKKVFRGSPEGKGPKEDLGVDRRII